MNEGFMRDCLNRAIDREITDFCDKFNKSCGYCPVIEKYKPHKSLWKKLLKWFRNRITKKYLKETGKDRL